MDDRDETAVGLVCDDKDETAGRLVCDDDDCGTNVYTA